ncbi:MAG: hypothetical protein HYX94_04995 [Chloroflexi bacterium]|nr:hypothetical protein [Chloroflexota bacterium]
METRAKTPREIKAALRRYSKDELLRLYNEMLLIRRFEEKAAEMYVRAKIGG